MIPYKLYINWTGKYTTGTMSGTFTDITDDVYDLAISVSRKRDKKSIAIVRNFATGSFVIKDSNYDLLKTAIANGLPELIIRIDKYSTVAVDYVEVWRGSAETRPAEMDDNRNFAKINKFNTIDLYSDVDISYSKSFTEIYADYLSVGSLVEGTAGVKFISSKKLYSTEQIDSYETVNWEGNIESRYQSIANYRITPGYYDSGFTFFFGSFNSRERGLISDSISTLQSSTDANISFSLKKILELYKTMFNLFWYIDDATYGVDVTKSIQLKTPSQLFNLNTIDYTAESADFAAYNYLDIEYFIRESYLMSGTNVDVDHITQYFEYQLLAENDFIYSNDKIVTDFENYILSTDSGNTDTAIYTMDMNVAGTGGAIKSANSINGVLHTVINYICSLSHRMKYFLNDYRQLDSAKYNGSVQALNANVARPSIRQEAFSIELDLLEDLDFFATIETSIGDTYAEELIWDIKTDGIKLICQK